MKRLLLLLVYVSLLGGCTSIFESKEDVYTAERDSYLVSFDKLVNSLKTNLDNNNDIDRAIEKQYEMAKDLRIQFEKKVSPSAKLKEEYDEILTMFKSYEGFLKDMGEYFKTDDAKLKISGDNYFEKAHELWMKYRKFIKEE